MTTLTVDRAKLVVKTAAAQATITRAEQAVLAVLAAAGGRTVQPWAIYEAVLAVRGGQSEDPANDVRVHVCRLRRKLGADAIETEYGCGYRMGKGWRVELCDSAPVMVMVPDDLVAPLRRAAEAEGRTVEEMAAECIREFLE